MKAPEIGKKSLSLEAIKGTIFLGSWGTLCKVIGVVNSFIIIFLLTVHDYGLYTLILSVIGMAQVVLFESLDQLIINDILRERGAGNFDQAKKIYQEYFANKLFFSIIGFLILFFGAQAIADYYGYSSIGLFIKLGALLIMVYGINDLLQLHLNIHKKFFQMGGFAFFQEAVKFVILTSLIMIFKAGIAKVLLAMVLSNISTIILIVFTNFKGFKEWLSNFKIDFNDLILWKIFKAHGKWNIMSDVVAKFQKNIRPWLIQVFIGTNGVAYYNFGKNLYLHLDSLLPVSKVIYQLLPEVSYNLKRMQRSLVYGTKYITVLMIIFNAAGLLFVPVFINLVFPKYLPSLPVFYVFMIIPLTYGGLLKVCDTIIFSLRKQRFLTLQLILRTILVIVLNTILLPLFGVIGIAIERVLTMLIVTVIYYFKTTSILGLGRSIIFKMFRHDEFDAMLIANAKLKIKEKLIKLLKIFKL